jgi:hypothetical protein
MRFQKFIDVTGNALAQTPWIRHFAPGYSGFTDLMQATGIMLKYMKVILRNRSQRCDIFLGILKRIKAK